MAVGGGGEVNVGDNAYKDGADGDWVGGVGEVEDGAAYEVADVAGVFVFELKAFGGGDDDFEAGEEFGGVDGVDAGEVEDDASLVFADGEPVGGDLGDAGCGFGAGEVGGSEEDPLVGVEAFGEVGEEFGEDLAFTALGAEELCQDNPLRYLFRYGSIAIRYGVLRKVGW